MSEATRVAIRTTAGAQIGFGHLRRCLSLAEALRRDEVDSVFLVDGPQIALEQVAAEGFLAIPVAEQKDPANEQICSVAPDAVVVDSYAFGPTQFCALGRLSTPLIAVHDCGDPPHNADVVVNGSASAKQSGYECRNKTAYLLGPRYALLRPEFGTSAERGIGEQVERVLITLGGSDPWRLSRRLAQWTAQALPEAEIHVVVGPGFQETTLDIGSRAVLHHDPPDMRRLMRAADLAVCGGGQTTYELAATGTPAVAIRLADNQTVNLMPLSEVGTLLWAGDAEDSDLRARTIRALITLSTSKEARARMSGRGRTLVDGQGAHRVAGVVRAMAMARHR